MRCDALCLFGVEVVKLYQRDSCRSRANDYVVSVMLGVLQNPANRPAQFLETATCFVLSRNLLAVNVAQCHIERARADRCDTRKDRRRPPPRVSSFKNL